MGVVISSFNLNISPKMSYSVLECDVTELHAYDFVMKKGVICARPCMRLILSDGKTGWISFVPCSRH